MSAILVYVDDFIIACNDFTALHDFKDYLQRCFRMKDLGKLKHFLGSKLLAMLRGSIYHNGNTPLILYLKRVY